MRMNRKIRSVMDSRVAFNIELSEFESQQGNFFNMFFFFVYIVYFYVFILSFALKHYFDFFTLSFHNYIFSLSILIFSSFYNL